ncbi:MAG: heavy metal translocating P-type ATPase [Beijerinckiaceae bacterium]|nr:heavy metal translocating P-type ATPase [Beijerinckiaceae bacterium]MCZ8299264.1 heavy metal translocating P-type ATPase [Beijerinckiaceae bacterium]
MAVDLDSNITDLRHFLRASPDESFVSLDLAVDGIKCAACMATIERAMSREPGVVGARVNLGAKRLHVTFERRQADPARILRRLDELGFKAYPFSPRHSEDSKAQEMRRLLRCLGVAAFASMNVMLLSVAVWSGHETGLDPTTRDLFHWLSALIALPTAAYSGRPFYESAIGALKRRRVNMDVPITLGICLALVMSVFEVLRHGEHAYFDGVVMLLFFLLIGRTLDQIMQRRTQLVAANLAALRAESATKRLPDGTWRDVPIDMVEPGDVILVRIGDRVAADGRIEEGRSDIDQSLVTGETVHRAVRPGDEIYAGTQNLGGALVVRVLKSQEGTLLAGVERLLAQAAQTKGAYIRLADRAARLYPPFVHTVALLTFIGWMMMGLGWHDALMIAITVLIITCPCALGLAVPAVQVVAAGAMFRNGILIQSGDAIERLAEIDRIVFDKTGTLTLPAADIANREEIPAEDVALAARLALTSRHPLAAAIAAQDRGAKPLATAREVPGEGVKACHGGHVVRLGSPAFCEAIPEAEALAARFPGASIVAFRHAARLALFAIRQPYREDAAATIAALGAMNLPAEIISGDRPRAVAEAARDLGIANWRGGALPGDKVTWLEQMKRFGARPLMVGDGLNDAPALAAGHASIAPASASQLTQTQADFLLVGQRLGAIVPAIRIARKARWLMLENLWISVLYNLIAVPVAILGHATPLVAALAMSGSSIIVTLNALRAGRGAGEKP